MGAICAIGDVREIGCALSIFIFIGSYEKGFEQPQKIDSVSIILIQ